MNNSILGDKNIDRAQRRDNQGLAIQTVTESSVEASAHASIERWVREEIRALSAYHVAPADGLLKLDAMESPFELPEGIKDEWLSAVSGVSINRYPDPSSADLKHALRETFKIPQDAQIMVGNGSDELIQIIVMLVGGEGRKILAPEPTFSMYQIISIATGSDFVGVPLNDDFSIDPESLLEAIETHQPSCVFLAYPNNPTGNCFDPEIMKRVIRCAPGLVVVDEAYFAFCQRGFMEDLSDCPNLIILRTMSKSGMAGLRVGFLAAHPLWVQQLEKLRLPYNIDNLTQVTAAFYLKHHDVLQGQANVILQERDWLIEQMSTIEGIEVFPSDANFLLLKVQGDVERVFQRLVSNGVLIRNLHKPDSKLDHCLRVTISNRSENTVFLETLIKVLSEQ